MHDDSSLKYVQGWTFIFSFIWIWLEVVLCWIMQRARRFQIMPSATICISPRTCLIPSSLSGIAYPEYADQHARKQSNAWCPSEKKHLAKVSVESLHHLNEECLTGQRNVEPWSLNVKEHVSKMLMALPHSPPTMFDAADAITIKRKYYSSLSGSTKYTYTLEMESVKAVDVYMKKYCT